ncbi:MAG TPA: elongation factor G [Thermomicrobiales bacterium]|nr:elongation factor G [Thermomicrobiales bacterium]
MRQIHYPADHIWNVGLFSHGGAGKTSIAEALLFDSKTVNRLGRVEDGTTASDFDPDEIRRRMSIGSSLLPIEIDGNKLNILDVPGYADFAGEMVSAMRVVDGAIVVVDASAGVEVGTEKIWAMAEAIHLPRVVFANKMDRENASFDATLASLRDAFGKRFAPVQFPIGQEKAFRGIVDLLTDTAMVFHENGDGEFDIVPVPEDLAESCSTYRLALVESIAEHNEELMLRYLDGEEIPQDELLHELHGCIADGTVIPLLCGAATANRGITPLLKAIRDYLPSAAERAETATVNGEHVDLVPDAGEPLAALAFKTIADPHVGRVTWFRVFSGSIDSHGHIWNPRTQVDERIGQLFYPRGKEHLPAESITAGDIGAVSKLTSVQTGDTVTVQDQPLILDGIDFPQPAYSAAVVPESKSDLDKLSAALQRLHEEDPSLMVGRSENGDATIVSGLGEPHVQIAVERMERRSGVHVQMKLPAVPYRETIAGKVVSEYKHKKQTGGAGQYGHVFLKLEPCPDEPFAFDEEVVGGTVPKNYFPAVEKGVRDALDAGPIAGYPVVNVRAVLTDGSYHAVDSNEMAFRIAAKEAFRKGMKDASPSLLEPVLHLWVTVPEAIMGDVMGDLNTRRAHVDGMTPDEHGAVTIEAHVPAAEVQRYATDLRSISQGRGAFRSEFAYYQPVPGHLVDRIRQEATAGTAVAAS